jgi:hypothetical protein
MKTRIEIPEMTVHWINDGNSTKGCLIKEGNSTKGNWIV